MRNNARLAPETDGIAACEDSWDRHALGREDSVSRSANPAKSSASTVTMADDERRVGPLCHAQSGSVRSRCRNYSEAGSAGLFKAKGRCLGFSLLAGRVFLCGVPALERFPNPRPLVTLRDTAGLVG